jgi:hypothetical protein
MLKEKIAERFRIFYPISFIGHLTQTPNLSKRVRTNLVSTLLAYSRITGS